MDETTIDRDDEISLLDLAVVIAENWKLLVFVPLLVGALVYFAMNAITPRMFTSEALIRADAHQIALLQSARVLNEPIRESSFLNEHGNRLSVARTNLLDAMRIDSVDGTDMYRVRLTLDDADKANQLLTQLINKLIAESEPVGYRRDMLQLQLETQQAALDDLTDSFTRLNEGYSRLLTGADGQPPLIQGEIGQSLVALISNIESKRQQVASTTQALTGSLTQDDIIQPPTLPDEPRPRGLLMRVALAVVITGFVLLIGAFARAGFARASDTPDGAAKVNRIRRAFWLKPKPAATGENPAP